MNKARLPEEWRTSQMIVRSHQLLGKKFTKYYTVNLLQKKEFIKKLIKILMAKLIQ